ncbi:MAG: trehalose-phosphatase [Dehalococcoidia bacterium]|nr:trehalose-phosphatase [Dehalococcoidia bacterium]
MAEPLTEHWPDIEARIRAADHVLIASDFDGTLSPIVPRPEVAYILPECADALRQLTEKPGYAVAIVSGRALNDVRERAGLPNAIYSGNHGIEIAAPGLAIEDDVADRARRLMAELRRTLEPAVSQISGAFVEDKGVSLSVHSRMSPDELEPKVQEIVRDATATAVNEGKIIVVQGKKVLDIRPAAARDKGAALRFIMDTLLQMAETRLFPIYIGDDTTDEDAFREVNLSDGISVLVGGPDRDTSAAYRLDSPIDVAAFLTDLANVK